MLTGPPEMADFSLTSNFDLKYFCSLLTCKNLKVLHLKDLIHICLESEGQGCGMIFYFCYIGSKDPYFISCRGYRKPYHSSVLTTVRPYGGGTVEVFRPFEFRAFFNSFYTEICKVAYFLNRKLRSPLYLAVENVGQIFLLCVWLQSTSFLQFSCTRTTLRSCFSLRILMQSLNVTKRSDHKMTKNWLNFFSDSIFDLF